MLRSPHLVPYSKVDDAIKKANRYNVYLLQIIQRNNIKRNRINYFVFFIFFVETLQAKQFVLCWCMVTI